MDDDMMALLVDGYRANDTTFDIQNIMLDTLTMLHLSRYDTDQLLAVFQNIPMELLVPNDIDLTLALVPEYAHFLGPNGLLTVGILDWFRFSVVLWYWEAWEDMMAVFWDDWEEVSEEDLEGWEEE